jgi:1-acyl-sn-glycerol-3-phosphate acyltransferase
MSSSQHWIGVKLTMMYSFILFFLRAILRIIARVTVYGMDYLPGKDKTYLAVTNHIGRLDPVFAYYLLQRKDIIMLVAEKYKEQAWSRLLAQSVEGIFVDRFNADLGAMREVLRRIEKGGVVVLAPEGTRSPAASLIQGWDGASYIAAKVGLPILPVGVTGSSDREVMFRLKHFKRLQISISIGPTFTLPPLEAKNRDEQLAKDTEEIMCRIAAELPESYRGVYANCPHLKDLLDEKALRKTGAPLVLG